jgi:hypothetical protein
LTPSLIGLYIAAPVPLYKITVFNDI